MPFRPVVPEVTRMSKKSVKLNWITKNRTEVLGNCSEMLEDQTKYVESFVVQQKAVAREVP